MPLNIRKAKTALKEGVGHAKILIWGNSGSGKSWLSATAPKPLICLTEKNGMVSIANSNQNADFVFIENVAELRELIAMAKSGELKKYQTLCFDSLTELQKMIRDGILNGRSSDQMKIQDWGKLAQRTIGFIREIRDLPFHIVCTALKSDSINEEGAVISVGPAFEGRKTGNEVMQYFSAVAALHSQKKEDKTVRSLYFSGPQRMMVKPCHPIDGQIENPNLTEIINSIINNKAITKKGE